MNEKIFLLFSVADEEFVRRATTLFGLGISWTLLVVNVVILPFYSKSESLHKDYWASGKINSTIAAIEARLLIPTLAKMFNLAADNQSDKRKRIAEEMEDLLQGVQFIPHLQAAQSAMSQMDLIRFRYEDLKQTSARLWKSGLLHVVFTLCLPAIELYVIPLHDGAHWLFWIISLLWAVTLIAIARNFFRFHRFIQEFIASLEINVKEDM